MKRLRILTLVLLGVAVAINFSKPARQSTQSINGGLIRHSEWLTQLDSSITPVEDQRPADQTFLTYPEWFLVHSPAEQAAYFREQTSTKFPFDSHIDQIWDSYAIISGQIEDHYPHNSDYHLMIKVIGSSASAEYALKGWYELVIGRLTDTLNHEVLSEEDVFNYQFTQDYVDFIREIPWYEFDFQGELIQLWRGTDFFGSHLLRKLERKYILTSELMVKAVYARLIKLGTRSLYDPALLTTVVVLDYLPDSIASDESLVLLETLDDGVVMRVPRYAAFNPTALKIAKAGASFREIAGNDSAILLTVLAESDWSVPCGDGCETLFVQPVQSNPDLTRIALVTTVPDLSELLLLLDSSGVLIEHIYDY